MRTIAELTSGASQTSRPTSVLPPPFRPTWTPPARKPGASCAGSSSSTPARRLDPADCGRSALSRSGRLLRGVVQPLGLVEAEHQVQVLDALAGGALPDVVDRREGHHPAVLLDRDVDVALVGVAQRPQVRRPVEDPDERLVGVALLVERATTSSREVGSESVAKQVASSPWSSGTRCGHEGDRRRAAERRQLLFDLRPVPVALGLVGEGVLGHRARSGRGRRSSGRSRRCPGRRRRRRRRASPCSASGASPSTVAVG